MAASTTVKAFRAGHTLVACAAVTTLVFVGLAFSDQWLEAGMCPTLLGVMVATWTVVTVTLRQRLVPNAMLGRVASAFRLPGYPASPSPSLALRPLGRRSTTLASKAR